MKYRKIALLGFAVAVTAEVQLSPAFSMDRGKGMLRPGQMSSSIMSSTCNRLCAQNGATWNKQQVQTYGSPMVCVCMKEATTQGTQSNSSGSPAQTSPLFSGQASVGSSPYGQSNGMMSSGSDTFTKTSPLLSAPTQPSPTSNTINPSDFKVLTTLRVFRDGMNGGSFFDLDMKNFNTLSKDQQDKGMNMAVVSINGMEGQNEQEIPLDAVLSYLQVLDSMLTSSGDKTKDYGVEIFFKKA